MSFTLLRSKSESVIEDLDNRFFAIKVKQQRYQGKQAIVIFMSDATKKVKTRILAK